VTNSAVVTEIGYWNRYRCTTTEARSRLNHRRNSWLYTTDRDLPHSNMKLRKPTVYIGWNDVTYLWSQYDRHFVGQDRRTVRSLVAKICRVIRIKLNQLVYKNVRFIAILLRKWCPNKKRFAELDLQHGGKIAGIDMIWRNYVTVTLCQAFAPERYRSTVSHCLLTFQ